MSSPYPPDPPAGDQPAPGYQPPPTYQPPPAYQPPGYGTQPGYPQQPGYGAQPGYQQPPTPNVGTNALAIAALVSGIIWICGLGSLLAVVLGIIALAQIKRSRQQGRGLAIAGIVLGALGLLATIAVALSLWAFGNAVEDQQDRYLECVESDDPNCYENQ